jgi:soluble lytic murein transglycosylase
MLGTFALILAAAAADPRPDLVELQLAGQNRQALARVEQELADRPEPSHKIGLDYLRGHLLDTLRQLGEATEAFVRTLSTTPVLKLHALYRLAYDEDLLGHPEVAAGLVATPVAGPSSPLLPEAVWLLDRTLARGGDCKILQRLRAESMPSPQRREIELARGACALRGGYPEVARSLFVSLLGESQDDEIARVAADRLAATLSESEHGRVPLLVGITFQRHGDLERALVMLQRAVGKGNALPARETYETQLRIGEVELALQHYAEASLAFTHLVATARTAADRAHALYLEGHSHELRASVATADRNFLQAYAAEPQGAWAPRALLAALRLEWRAGSESQALSLYEKLTADPKWRGETARASLFLAASDVVRGRRDRVEAWLTKARQGGSDERLEADYWNGRLAELEKNGKEAVSRYLDVLRADPDHPLARAARARLAAEPLARTTAAEGRRLAGSDRLNDVYGAWLLLGGEPAGRASTQRRLEQMLLGDRRAAPFLRLAEVPVRRWPLWDKTLAKPEEMLLALGVWHSGSPAIRDQFPLSDPSLGFTGALLLARSGDYAGSIAMGEALRERAPSRVPLALQPAEYRRLLYPFPYRPNIVAGAQGRGFDPNLLAALIREESRFDTSMLSPASSHGLAGLSLSTARRVAGQLNLQRLGPEDLYRPEVSIALGAAYLGALLKGLSGHALAATAAYDAGEAEASLWKSQCFSQEPEELYTKLGTSEARDYVRRVMGAWGEYGELY